MPFLFNVVINGAHASIVRISIGANSSTRCFNKLQRSSSDSEELNINGC
jgi:hypothetical protein